MREWKAFFVYVLGEQLHWNEWAAGSHRWYTDYIEMNQCIGAAAEVVPPWGAWLSWRPCCRRCRRGSGLCRGPVCSGAAASWRSGTPGCRSSTGSGSLALTGCASFLCRREWSRTNKQHVTHGQKRGRKWKHWCAWKESAADKTK